MRSEIILVVALQVLVTFQTYLVVVCIWYIFVCCDAVARADDVLKNSPIIRLAVSML